jgi:exosortase
VAALACLCWPSLVELAAIYDEVEDYSHGYLVPLISLYTAYDLIRQHGTARWQPARWGLLLLGAGMGSLLFSQWYQAAMLPDGMGVGCLGALGIIACMAGGGALAGGAAALRQLRFPLGFLVFAVPLPLALTQPLTLSLRHLVSACSEPIVRLLGITVYREGNVIHLAATSLGVADACSGIRSLIVLLAAGAALAHLNRLPWKSAAFLTMMAVPIAALANLVRVVVTVLLVDRYSVSVIEGWRHDALGWLTFAIGLALLLAVERLLCRPGSEEDAVAAAAEFALPAPLPRPSAIAATVLLLLGAGVSVIVHRHYTTGALPPAIPRRALAEFPDQLGAYAAVGEGALLERQEDVLQPTDYIIRTYRTASGRLIHVRLMFWAPMLDARGRVGPRFHAPDACYPSWGYTKLESYDDSTVLADGSAVAECRLFERPSDRQAVLYWGRRRQLGAMPGRLPDRIAMLLRSWNEPFLDYSHQYLVTLATNVGSTPDPAYDELRGFADTIVPLLAEYGFTAGQRAPRR